MDRRPDSKTYYTVFFIIGLVFLLMGAISPLFLVIGVAFFVIGLVGMLREKQKENQSAEDQQEMDDVPPVDEEDSNERSANY
jgi:preprotein translocase subunit Sss1